MDAATHDVACKTPYGALSPVREEGTFISQMNVQFITANEPRKFILGVRTTPISMKKQNSTHLVSAASTDHLIAPYFFDGSVNHPAYLIMLQE